MTHFSHVFLDVCLYVCIMSVCMDGCLCLYVRVYVFPLLCVGGFDREAV